METSYLTNIKKNTIILNMLKKICLFVICLLCVAINFVCNTNNIILAEENLYKICISDCTILLQPNTSLDNNILEVKKYGEEIKIDTIEVVDENINSSLKFYKVLDENNNIKGYVLTSAVVNINENALKVKLQSNAKLKTKSEVFLFMDNEYKNLKIEEENLVLDENTEIRILDKYNNNNLYTEISFDYNNQILTGYVLTQNIQVKGFNYYFLIAIFLLIIVGSTVIPIIIKNWKKKKLTDR